MKRIAVFAVALLVVVLAWTADHYYQKAISWRDDYRATYRVTRQQAATITDMDQRHMALAKLDKTHTEALSAAESENEALRRQLATGHRRMYVRGKCPVSGAGKTATPGGVGNGATVELAADSGQNVLDIRAGIISDQEKLRYLQEYIRTQCLK
ncbi:lysis protein [Salmonella enterica subsp. enterica]|uniref:Lysis protein n=1 Tax=Salmonella enterica subsp. enterica serovar Kottbus TaxID=224727 RepID=A0A5J0SAA5_SALET|nr:lysis protein [Salmonella enterica subsp. enterica serovar Kottbus]EBU6996492.1 lysis protein [Salmonella enterica subsp. enterica serovar Newport]EDN4394358.1 lysis protein [Salmonella enterica subsp. enterica]HCK3132162.1 lysis protein [Salmonella enterica subsp. enterica serovar Ruiru]EBS1861020.1 lysis protein [Salmonella enterica subsp. enterica serovar Kottbus]